MVGDCPFLGGDHSIWALTFLLVVFTLLGGGLVGWSRVGQRVNFDSKGFWKVFFTGKIHTKGFSKGFLTGEIQTKGFSKGFFTGEIQTKIFKGFSKG